MKRSIGVFVVAGIVLAASNAVFATPVEIWNQTINVAPGVWQDGTVPWLQPFSILPAYAGYTIDSATLTINAYGVNGTAGVNSSPGAATNEQDKVYVDLPNTGSWVYKGILTQSGDFSDSITNIVLGTGLTGDFGVRVVIDPSMDSTTPFKAQVNTAKLVVFANAPTVEPPEPPEPPQPPQPTVPAPGALLLAALGAGLVSRLRVSKTL